jgi:hypothetical protein
MLFDFMAQGDDEVTVAIGDEVLIIDDSASDEWWKVRRLKNGKEGVVPSNYVEITETVPISSSASHSARSGINAGRSRVDQNRLEEEELARQAARNRRHDSDAASDQRSKRDSSTSKDAKTGSKPNPSKIRTWTDRSGSFKVEAEFLTIKDGKIHLHKVNGVKIAVPVPKMSVEDLEYVERATGISLDDDKPLSDIKRRSTQRLKEQAGRSSSSGITVEKKLKYDWFDFFLQCGVNPQICERYAQGFEKDQMGEENLPDITDKLLRTLGVKEGDILRVMKFLDNKFGRTGDREKRSVSFAENGEEGSGGLFSGPGGVLRNNTRKGRPAPPVQTNDVVDPKAFEQKSDDAPKKPADSTATPLAAAPVPEKKVEGFEDSAWDVKPSRQPTPAAAPMASPPPASTQAPAAAPAAASTPAAPAPAPAPSAPALTGAMSDLSLLMPAIKPEIPAQSQPQAQTATPQQPQPTGPAGANQSLFDQVAAIQALPPQPLAPPRVRPQAPQQTGQAGLIAPPPQRSASAPQNPLQSQFGPPPLQPQHTGYGGLPNMHTQVAPPGQSLQDLNMQRLQQQMTGYPQQNPAFQQQGPALPYQQNGIMSQPTGIMPQPTGYQTMSPPLQQPMQTGYAPQMAPMQMPMATGYQGGFQPGMQQGFPNSSPFADPPRAPFQPMQPQPTGYNSFSPSPLNPQATGINRFLPPAIQPTVTGIPPMPPMPTSMSNSSMPAAQALVPQKTGPPPPVRFGVQPAAKKLVAQPTGRANLANATPQNPFGF